MLLSVNPEIEVEYDESGLVLEIEGANEDGKRIAEDYTGYAGKECSTVVNELVQEIYKAGHFDETVDGHTKNIVVKLEDGSACPSETFLDDVAGGVRDAVQTCGIGSKAITVDQDDLDAQGYIGEEKARELAMAQLGLAEASFNQHTHKLDDGVYEMEFSANGVTYDYEADACTGKILEADIDGNDDWDDRDDWDDWQDDRLDNDDDDLDDNDDGRDDSDDDLDDNDDRGDDNDDDNSITIPVNGDDLGDNDDRDDSNDDQDDGNDDQDDSDDDD